MKRESGTKMALIDESIAHGERGRNLASNAVRDYQRGHRFAAEVAMDMAAMERHLQYEKWDTHKIAWKALEECWAARA